MRYALSALLIVASTAASAFAQVVASQAPTPTPTPQQELCPLQLDIDVHKLEDVVGHTLVSMPAGGGLSTRTGQYVCDKAQVESVTITKETERPREVLIVVNALVSSGWMRQDVDLTVSLLVKGEIKKSETYRSLTIGDPNANWASRNVAFAGSSSKTRGLRFWVKRDQFNDWFGPATQPSIRITMAVVDSGDDEEDEEE